MVLATHLRACKIGFEQEYKFHPKRKWRADFLIIGTKILIEVEGGIWSGGRHTRGKRLYRGYGEIQLRSNDGFYSFTVQHTEQVKAGVAIKQIEQLVGEK